MDVNDNFDDLLRTAELIYHDIDMCGPGTGYCSKICLSGLPLILKYLHVLKNRNCCPRMSRNFRRPVLHRNFDSRHIFKYFKCFIVRNDNCLKLSTILN